jgi:hypothetical protein
LYGKELFVGISLKENELWLVIKASGSQTRHRQVGAIFDAANIAIADCVVPMISQPGQSIDGKSCNLTAREIGKSYAKCFLAKSGYAFL